MIKGYRTILSYCEAEIVEKKSRFIASAFPAASEDEAMMSLAQIRKKHSLASHNCYAMRIMNTGLTERFSDDGEPSQTAGIPILSVLRGMELLNVIVIVTRYFGGTLLGTGGLVRAYSSSAKKCLTDAAVIDKKLYMPLEIVITYANHSKVLSVLREKSAFVNNTAFGADIMLDVLSEAGTEGGVIAAVTDATGGMAVITSREPVFGYALNGKVIVG